MARRLFTAGFWRLLLCETPISPFSRSENKAHVDVNGNRTHHSDL